MRYLARERLALWVDVLLSVATGIASVWFAVRIGSQEAIRFSRYEEARKSRDLLRAMENELNLNERTLNRALDDWDMRTFERVQVVSPAFTRARDSEELFFIDPQTWTAMTLAYEKTLQEVLEVLRMRKADAFTFTQMRYLRYHAELLAAARPLLERDIASIEDRLRRLGTPDVSAPYRWDPDPPPTWSPEEEEAARRPATKGWTREGAAVYSGPLQDHWDGNYKHFNWGALHLPPKTAGPVVVTISTPLERGTKLARVWVYLAQTCPISPADSVEAVRNPDGMRRLLAGRWPGVTALSCPVRSEEHYVKITLVDPNRPIGWKWAFFAIENDQGERSIPNGVQVWKVGRQEDYARISTRAPEDAIVLPVGYLAAEKPAAAPTAREYVELGRRSIADGRYRKAVTEFTGALLADPSMAEALRGRADALRLAGRFQDAIADYTAALKFAPDEVDTLLGRGEAYHREGRARIEDRRPPAEPFSKAEQDFTRAIERDERRGLAWFRRGLLRMDALDFDRALDDLVRAAKLEAACEKQAEQAAARIRRFLEDRDLVAEVREKREVSRAKGLVETGMKSYEMSDYDAAIGYFKRAFYLSGYGEDACAASYNMACCYSLKGDRDRAFHWLEIALDRGWTDWVHILSDDDFKNLREDPRWKALVGTRPETLERDVRHARVRREDDTIRFEAEQKPPDRDEAEDLARQASAAFKAGEYDKALPHLKRLFYSRVADSEIGVRIAVIYARLKDAERTLTWLEFARDYGYAESVESNPEFEFVRDDPRFQKIARSK